MAYDGYRGPPPAEHPAFFEYTVPRVQYPDAYPHDHASDIPRARPREHSSARGDGFASDTARQSHSQHPINEAVSSAFHTAEPSSYVPPELVAQITENVIKQLKTTGLEGGTPIPQQHQQPPPPPPLAQSPPNRSGSSPVLTTRTAHGPPSPRTKPEHPMGSSPPPISASNSTSHTFRESQFAHTSERKSSSPPTQSTDSEHKRPKGPVRLSTSQEETTLEKIWGQLFDEAGHPTVRLGQFLRGLAIHIVGLTVICP